MSLDRPEHQTLLRATGQTPFPHCCPRGGMGPDDLMAAAALALQRGILRRYRQVGTGISGWLM
jgi:hypothetical protein